MDERHDEADERKPSARGPESGPERRERRETEIKVSDRRMFTPEGELREEYRHLADAAPPKPQERPVASEPSPPPPSMPSPGAPSPRAPLADPTGGGAPAGAAAAVGGERAPSPGAGGSPGEAGRRPEVELPRQPGGGPGFLDLVGMLVESAAVYLGDARLPDGGTAEDLDLARFHVDLLDVLRKKTAGNLSAQESAALDDILYRLRMRYVQKRG